MVINGAPVYDPDKNPYPRIELRYGSSFNTTSNSSYRSMNYTGALMNFLPGPATRTCVGQVFMGGGTCGSGALLMVRFVSAGNTTRRASIAVVGVYSVIAYQYITLTDNYTLGTKFSIGILFGGGQVKFFYNNLVTPVATAPLVKACDNNIFKVGNYHFLPDPTAVSAADTSTLQLFSVNVSN
jgi:hypothetical protein